MAEPKKSNMYKINLQEVQLKDGTSSEKSLDLEFENHDDLFKVIELVTEKNIFSDKSHSIEFILGLKLFTEVMLKNKDHPLFEELKPAILQFMKKLKSQPAS
ncbi:MAG: DUF3861 domain-containing protein [Saezia sp.]